MLLELARQGLHTRGSRIRNTLSGLIVAQLFLAVLFLGLAAVLWAFWRTVFSQLSNAATSDQSLPGWLGWGVGAGFLLNVAVVVIYLLMMLAARRAIVSVERYAAGGEAGELTDDVGRLNAWLSAWQWYTIVAGLLALALIPVILYAAQLLGADTGSTLGGGELAFVSGFGIVGVLIQYAPTVVLTWLALAAVKRFFAAVALHARAAQTLVTPAATNVSGWLIFTIVVLALGVAAVLLSGLSLALVSLIPDLGGNLGNPTDTNLSANELRLVLGGSGVFILLLAAAYGFIIALVAWSRGFALDAATLLDASLPTAGQSDGLRAPLNTNADAWGKVNLDKSGPTRSDETGRS